MRSDLERRLTRAELTYAEVGGTAAALPPGYHHLRRSVVTGAGAASKMPSPKRSRSEVHLRGKQNDAPAASKRDSTVCYGDPAALQRADSAMTEVG